MAMGRPNRRAGVLLPAASLLLVAVAGCTAGDPSAAPPSASAPLPSTTSSHRPSASSTTLATTADTAEAQAVIQAYDGMWADMVQAARTADYRSPVLAAHTADPATGQLQRTLLTYSRLGVVVKGAVHTDPRVTSLNPQAGQATLIDCLDDRDWLTYDAATGKLTDDRPGGRTVTDATLRRVDGAWKISSYVVHVGQSC